MTIEPKLMTAEQLARIREHHDGWNATEQSRLLAHIAAQDQRIAALTQLATERYEEAEELHAAAGEPTQTARPTIAGLRLQLSIATELNVNDRKQIDRLETALSVANQVAGEAALVLEQQDRDLEKLRARVVELEAQWSDLKPLC